LALLCTPRRTSCRLGHAAHQSRYSFSAAVTALAADLRVACVSASVGTTASRWRFRAIASSPSPSPSVNTGQSAGSLTLGSGSSIGVRIAPGWAITTIDAIRVAQHPQPNCGERKQWRKLRSWGHGQMAVRVVPAESHRLPQAPLHTEVRSASQRC
jgi:hypothetical protein